MKFFYGLPKVGLIEVTEIIRSLAKDNHLSIYSKYNTLFGDPLPNMKKVLIVDDNSFPEDTVPLFIDLEKEIVSEEPLSFSSLEFYFGSSEKTIERVTEKVLPLLEKDLLRLDEEDYAKYFPKNFSEKGIFFIDSPYLGRISIEEGTPFTFSVSPPSLPKINIVYFINTSSCPGDYLPLLIRQLTPLKNSGILEAANLYIEATSSNPEKLREELFQLIPSAKVNIGQENLFEYPGIKKVWELANLEKESYLFYFHAKGITRAYTPDHVDIIEEINNRDFIPLWKKWCFILSSFPSLSKLGFFSSREGFPWFNIFWAKGEYLITCEEPIINPWRFYYEHWASKCSGPRTFTNFFNAIISPLPCLFRKTGTTSNIGSYCDNFP